jgi:hypothetical protein
MPGLVPGIHAFLAESKTWMAGTSPAMTLWAPRPLRTQSSKITGK